MMDRRITRFTYRTLESEGCKSAEKKNELKNVAETICANDIELRTELYDLYYFATEIGPDKSRVFLGVVHHRRRQKFTAIYERDEYARRTRIDGCINFFLFFFFSFAP